MDELEARMLALEARVAALESGRPRLPLTLARVRQEAVAGIAKGERHGAMYWRDTLARIIGIINTADATTTNPEEPEK